MQYYPRDIHGVLLLDKPYELSSNKALQKVKHLFQAKKAGHTGALDPLATGMLPICFGEATKYSQFLLEAHKHYRVKVVLGITTTTGDTEGEVLERKPMGVYSPELLNQCLTKFRGEILQTPSMFSALKHKGKPLYKYARQGIDILRPARKVIIHSLLMIKYDHPNLYLDVVCSKGTYIRNLAEDIGKALGCGAHVGGLRRVGVGNFKSEEMVTIESLEALALEAGVEALTQKLRPTQAVCHLLPTLSITEAAWKRLIAGQRVQLDMDLNKKHYQLVLDTDQKLFLGVAKVVEGNLLAAERIRQADPM